MRLSLFFSLFLSTGFSSMVSLSASDLAVGQPFPALVLPSLEDGEPLSASGFQDKKTVLHIWASW
ncbi:MAG TPA: hypothetical protein VMY18_04330 [Acidobacteriota bacterium]|nr:hypothetical protein [Acidobacteriota bacterium]